MITVSCKECGKKYQIDPAQIKGTEARFKCASCNNMVVVTIPEPEEIHKSELIASNPGPAAKKSRGGSGEEAAEGALQKIKWRNSIQVKMSVILIILTTIIFAGFILYTYNGTHERMNDELAQFGNITATRLSQSLVMPLWNLADKEIGGSILSEMMDKRIAAIIMRDKDGKSMLYGWARDPNWKAVEAENPSINTGDFIVSSEKIVKGEETIGVLEVYLTGKFIREELNRTVFGLLITALVLIIAISGAVFLGFRRLLVQPIMQLTDAAKQMSLGDLNVDIAIHSNNEIGLLATAIRRMQTSLRVAMDRLRRRTPTAT